MEVELLSATTAPDEFNLSLSYGQPCYRFDINKKTAAAVVMASSLVLISQTSALNVKTDQFKYLQSDIPAIELFVDSSDSKNLSVSEIVKYVLKFYGLGKTHLCNIAGISRPALYAWLNNGVKPDLTNFNKVRVLYNIAQELNPAHDKEILWSYLEQPLPNTQKSLYDLMVESPNLDTSELRQYINLVMTKSEEYNKNLLAMNNGSFKIAHSDAEQELNLEDNM